MSIDLGLVLGDIRVNRNAILEVKRNYLVDRRQLHRWELAAEHLGIVPLIVEEDQVVQTDPVADDANLAVGALVQAVRQSTDEFIGPFHELRPHAAWRNRHSIGSSS